MDYNIKIGDDKMSYTALYRKWRPKSFDDVIGQDHIVKTLRNQIASQRVAHAYLFCGTRGTGKTTTAKIFARAINCTDTINGDACNECELCKDILAGRSMNVIEIDAASNNGVDNIREIREEAKYPPTQGKYKVYIIDEVHMLSIGAFNALLKTLEEPPAHVVFILATTDPQKIPATILSRCQRYDFRRISIEDMVSEIPRYMEQENVVVEDKALRYIAQLSDGAMRDALSILDQCIAFYYGEEITLQKVLDTVGAVDNEVFYRLTAAITQKDSTICMDIVDEIVIAGRDIYQFVLELVVHFRNLLVVKSSNSHSNILDLSQDNINKLASQAEKLSQTAIMGYIQKISELSAQLKYASNDRILLEVLLIKLCEKTVLSSNDYGELLERIAKLETNLSKGVVIKQEVNAPAPEPKKLKPQAIPDDIKAAIKLWDDVKQGFELPFSAILSDTTAGYLEDNFYYIKCLNIVSQQSIDKNLDVLSNKLEEKTGKSFLLKTILQQDFEDRYGVLYGKPKAEAESDAEFASLLGTLDLDGVDFKID
jgi:DNA polymerase-3 subunit gamma/tau